ncbi:triose-phosphate transporter family-domain-containing protein [Ochromonadaceae sp. CCMP2298]|nr:triose-phosphate transporter family-domain-containing protein [Ochromonadaceae sp. CCMP2298]
MATVAKTQIAGLRKPAAAAVHSAPSFLKNSEGEADVVAAAVVEAPATLLSKVWNEQTKLGAYLAVWYLGNIYYNIWNKKACIALGKNAHGASNLHWMLSAVQLLVGVLFVVPLWLTGLRKAPEMSSENWKELAPVGLFASLAHAFSVLALGAGAVSFGQIVKAAEPVFAAATNAILLKDIDHPLVYAALIPIIGGVGLASLKELSFSWTALIAASAANQAAAIKNVVSKGVMGKPWAKKLGAQNTYAVVTILALLFTLPFVGFFDVRDMAAVYDQIVAAGTLKDVVKYSFFSGLSFYIYNEASFLALERLSPVTHSVANTLKRVVIIVASCIVFKTPMTLIGGIGSGVAVLGTLLYSLAKKQFKKEGATGH